MVKRSRLTGLMLAGWGVMALSGSLSKPRIEVLHGSDILGLIGAGMCFGVAVVGLIGRLKVGND
jgi:hypothetical protein